MRNLGPKYEKEFFLIHNPTLGYGTRGEFWHCYVGENGNYYEVSQHWDNRMAPNVYEQEDVKYDPENYRREHTNNPKSYYIFAPKRCFLRRWMRENLR